jgi:hypothetical protein
LVCIGSRKLDRETGWGKRELNNINPLEGQKTGKAKTTLQAEPSTWNKATAKLATTSGGLSLLIADMQLCVFQLARSDPKRTTVWTSTTEKEIIYSGNFPESREVLGNLLT